MIIPKELKLDNWLLVTADEKMNAHYSKVISISADEIRVSKQEGDKIGMGCMDFEKDLKYIPLTPEILINNLRFVLHEEVRNFYVLKSHNSRCFSLLKINNNTYGLYDTDSAYDEFYIREIKYLHQLQNTIFYISDKELEINL